MDGRPRIFNPFKVSPNWLETNGGFQRFTSNWHLALSRILIARVLTELSFYSHVRTFVERSDCWVCEIVIKFLLARLDFFLSLHYFTLVSGAMEFSSFVNVSFNFPHLQGESNWSWFLFGIRMYVNKYTTINVNNLWPSVVVAVIVLRR